MSEPQESAPTRPDPYGRGSDGVGTPTGMGPASRGPEFAPGGSTPLGTDDQRSWSGPPAAWPRPTGDTYRPEPSRTPALVTVVVVAVVAAVVAVSSLVAYRSDTSIAPAPSAAARGATASPRLDTIPFEWADGTGELRVLGHRWVTGGTDQPASGSYLRVQVEVWCTSGRVDYDPDNFQTFDATGNLFDFNAPAAGDQTLAIGTLTAGQSVQGYVGFDMARGDVTLLMSDTGTESVAALRITD